MKVITVRLLELLERKVRLKAKLERRSVSEQINKYIKDAIVCEENSDLPYSFIKETLQAKPEIEAGLGKEYPLGIIQ
jgi:predicted nucleotidyltransferase